MAGFPPLKNSALTLLAWIRDADGDIIISPGGLTSIISIDGASDITGPTPTLITPSNKFLKLDLTAANMNGDVIGIIVKSTDTGAKEWAAELFTETVQISGAALDLLKKDFTGITGEAARSVLNALRLLVNKRVVSGGTLTVFKEDDAATAWTGSVGTTAGADPVTEIDPA